MSDRIDFQIQFARCIHVSSCTNAMQAASSKLPIVQRAPSNQLVKKKFTENEIRDLRQELSTNDHIIPLEKLCEKLQTDTVRGLREEEVESILLREGPNALTPPKVTPEYIKFIRCMFHGFAILLWICSALCFILYGISVLVEGTGGGIEWVGLIISCICLISGIFAYIQESKNTKVRKVRANTDKH